MTDSPYPSKPAIRVELCDGTGTWITYMPIQGSNLNDVLAVVGETFTWFVRGLVQDQAAVERHLGEFPGGE